MVCILCGVPYLYVFNMFALVHAYMNVRLQTYMYRFGCRCVCVCVCVCVLLIVDVPVPFSRCQGDEGRTFAYRIGPPRHQQRQGFENIASVKGGKGI